MLEAHHSSTTFVPFKRYALIITCATYESTTKWKPLTTPSKDGKAMYDYLEDHCHFDEVDKKQDKPKKMIEKSFDDLLSTAQNLAEMERKMLFFVYYSGHGTFERGETHGHTIYDEPFNLDGFVQKLACQANAYVIAFFDCCREIVEHKGLSDPPKNEPTNGQMFTIYSSAPKQSAIAVQEGALSVATGLILEALKDKAEFNFPSSLNNWEGLSKSRVEVRKKSHLDVCLPKATKEDVGKN